MSGVRDSGSRPAHGVSSPHLWRASLRFWWIGVVGVLAVLGSCGGLAHAAVFTSTPPQFVSSGAGPFVFGFRSSSDLAGSRGAVALLVPGATWDRCSLVKSWTLSGPLPDGVYPVTIADDVNVNYYASIGQLYSGQTEPCQALPEPAPTPGTPLTSFSLTVDSQPPSIAAPRVSTSGRYVVVAFDAADALSGVERVDVQMGDGASFRVSPPATHVTHTYAQAGNYSGQVAVTDKAGNTTATAFSATATTPAVSAPASTAPVPVTQRPKLGMDTARQRARVAINRRYGRRWGRGRGRELNCVRLTAASVRCYVRWRYGSRRYSGSASLRIVQSGGVDVALKIRLRGNPRGNAKRG